MNRSNLYDKEEVADFLSGAEEACAVPSGKCSGKNCLNVLSLFSGCGGMDLGFEGGFICNRRSVPETSGWIERAVNDNWVLLKKNRFRTVFANDILSEAFHSWTKYMGRFGCEDGVFHTESVVDLVIYLSHSL